MKPSTPCLILYFISCLAFLFFSYLDNQSLVLLFKSLIIPSIFVYYLVENEYKFDWYKVLILFLCFAGDMVVLLNLKFWFIYSVFLFLLVYLLIFKLVLADFKAISFRFKNFLPLIIIVALFIYLLISILNMLYQKDPAHNVLFFIYGCTLCIISVISTANYISNGNLASCNCALMIICFIISDIFYSLDHFYVNLMIFEMITLITQVLSYFFMVKYFLEIDKKIFIFTPE